MNLLIVLLALPPILIVLILRVWRRMAADLARLTAMSLLLVACAPSSSAPTPTLTFSPLSPLPRTPPVWQPAPGLRWQIQFTGEIEIRTDADVFDLDLFDTDPALIADLHARGKRVVCYINFGAWEDWRPDADLFPDEILGSQYTGWPGERWLDIRRLDLLAPILSARLDLCRAKGFDGVEPDNLDGFTNHTGFPLTARDQLQFNRWVADEAHARGLAVGLKNDPEQAKELEPWFDFALTEDCISQGWYYLLQPFLDAGKPVVAVEYTDSSIGLANICAQALTEGIDPLLKHRELDAWVQYCPPSQSAALRPFRPSAGLDTLGQPWLPEPVEGSRWLLALPGPQR